DPASIGWKCKESSRLSYDIACIVDMSPLPQARIEKYRSKK
ncbi:16102_t:CDS:1, partial [Funneliformis geosporum]